MAGEAGALTALAFAAKAHWGYPAETMEAWRDDLRITPEMLARPHGIACADGRVAGFYTLVPAPGDWELDNLWVDPRCMAQGIGRALVRHALAAARAGGAARIRIDSDPNAEPFYLACGAVRHGTVAAPIPGDPSRVRPQLVFALEETPGGRGPQA